MSLFNRAYSARQSIFPEVKFPQFKQNAIIDPKLHSSLGTDPGSSTRRFAVGVNNALVHFLTGEVLMEYDASQEVVKATYTSKNSGQHTTYGRVTAAQTTLYGDPAQPLATAFDYPALIGINGIALALTSDDLPYTLSKIQEIVAYTSYPVSLDALKQKLSATPELVELFVTFNDTLYQEMTQHIKDKHFISEGGQPQASDLKPLSIQRIQSKLRLKVAQTSSQTTPLDELRDLTESGGVALLVGPPGTFKTETISRLVLELSCPVIHMKGSPGVEDRDFYGVLTPNAEGKPEYVDGPITTAMMLARDTFTVVQIDEVLRYEPFHFNTVIGVFDTLSYESARNMYTHRLRLSGQDDKAIEQIIQSELPDQDTRYYSLNLPDGTMLFAPTRNMLWAMTTNWGDDHMQVASALDGALMSRIDKIIEFDRADREHATNVYNSVTDSNSELVAFTFELEDQIASEIMQNEEGLLIRALDARKSIAFLKVASRAMKRGLSLKDAAHQAARTTITPYICPRESNGMLKTASVARVAELINDALRA